MPTHAVSEAEVEEWIKNLGETFSDSEASFKAFEEKYLAAYDIIFDAIGKVVSLKESGRRGDAEVAMSKWMEPSRVIGVGTMKKTALKPALLTAAREALAQIDEKFAIAIDAYPTQVYLFPDDNILIRKESQDEDLRALGLA